jgi:hypothetical protein
VQQDTVVKEKASMGWLTRGRGIAAALLFLATLLAGVPATARNPSRSTPGGST